MRLYIAGMYAATFGLSGTAFNRMTENERWQRSNVKYTLESYHFVGKQNYVDRIRRDGVKVFLDSGAFSGFTQGVNIDLAKYCQYIKANGDLIEQVDGIPLYSVLDGIGDPLKTYQNQMEMERLGTRPLPCFHYGEDERYLDYYLANYEYITLGGMVAVGTKQLVHWLDRIWEKHLVDGTGRPKVRVHGFGLTTMSLVKRYPWFSVDSSSWVQTARTGGMMMYPEGKNIQVSARSPHIKVEGQHLDSLPLAQRTAIENKLVSMGVDLDRMRNLYLSRWAYNAWIYSLFGDLYTQADPIFLPEQPELF